MITTFKANSRWVTEDKIQSKQKIFSIAMRLQKATPSMTPGERALVPSRGQYLGNCKLKPALMEISSQTPLFLQFKMISHRVHSKELCRLAVF